VQAATRSPSGPTGRADGDRLALRALRPLVPLAARSLAGRSLLLAALRSTPWLSARSSRALQDVASAAHGRRAPPTPITAIGPRRDDRVPHPGHLASWAGICPGNNTSGGRSRSGRTRHGSIALRTALPRLRTPPPAPRTPTSPRTTPTSADGAACPRRSWRASQIPDTGPNKVRPGTEDDRCGNGVGSSRPSSRTRP
jgi:hypothetical protein